MASIEGLRVTIAEMQRFIRMAQNETDRRTVKFALTQIGLIAKSLTDKDIPEMLAYLETR